MKSNLQNNIKEVSTANRIRFVLLFYIVSALSIYLLEKWEPSGPCGIGMGMLIFIFAFIPVSAGISLYNLCSFLTKGKSFLIPALLHVAGLLIVLKLFW